MNEGNRFAIYDKTAHEYIKDENGEVRWFNRLNFQENREAEMLTIKLRDGELAGHDLIHCYYDGRTKLTDTIMQFGKPWTHPGTGEVRYYVDKVTAAEYGGLELDFYKSSGMIAFSELNGEEISHSEAGRMLDDVYNIWIDGTGTVKFKNGPDRYPIFWGRVKDTIEAKIREALA